MIRSDADANEIAALRDRYHRAVQQREQLAAQWSYGPGYWDAVSAAETEVDAVRRTLEAAVDFSALRVRGTICPTGAGVLTCPACADTTGFLLLANREHAIAVCRCGAVCRHHTLTPDLVTSHLGDTRRIDTAPARTGTDWPDQLADVVEDHPHAPDLALDIPGAWADAAEAEVDPAASHE